MVRVCAPDDGEDVDGGTDADVDVGTAAEPNVVNPLTGEDLPRTNPRYKRSAGRRRCTKPSHPLVRGQRWCLEY
jgi:hypothetical protein